MSQLTDEVLAASPRDAGGKLLPAGLALVGLAGLGIGFAGDRRAGWVALLVGTVLALGAGMFGILLSAIFEITGARWGRVYRRLAEASVVLMPTGIIGVLVLLAGAGDYLPWLNGQELHGHKALWLSRGFWSLRILLSVGICYSVGLAFLYSSLRRDFCTTWVKERYAGRLSRLLGHGIKDAEAEAQRCSRRMAVIAPLVAMLYAVTFSMLGFDLIMSLEPEWYSTLYGAWYFVGPMVNGLGLLAIASVVLRRHLPLSTYLTTKRQSDLATLLFAFVLLNTDFFWSQYLTIWYSHLPEETGYIIKRSIDFRLPWAGLSYLSLFGFFAIPFVALLFRRVKRSGPLLISVAVINVTGIVLARFLEVAPALIDLGTHATVHAIARPLLATLMAVLGVLGAGWGLYRSLLTAVPIMPVGDPIFVEMFGDDHK
ncbi:MAG TPA: hypothetical protein VF518_11070 [Polyangia bacterium]